MIRRVRADDGDDVISLCRAALGWSADDPNEAFFRWKHDQNPFGESPRWVAVAPDGALVGLRVFLRWRFIDGAGRCLNAVRAVDTATHPDWQGRGIFTRLTLGAIPDLREDGVDVIFNTPNDKSRPGYMKMGWSTVGRVPVGVRPSTPGSLRTMVGARTAAELWSEPTEVGLAASTSFDDVDATKALIESVEHSNRISTDVSPEYLRWRYRFEPLQYRVVRVGRDVEEGVVVFRLRRRGAALECAVCEVLAPAGAPVRPALAHLARDTGADYLLRCGGLAAVRDGFVPVPTLGPVLTWKPLRRPGVPSMGELSLTLGDVELF